MICPICGTVNLSSAETCTKCGRNLKPVFKDFRGSAVQPNQGTSRWQSRQEPLTYNRKERFTHVEIAKKMKNDYSYTRGDPTLKAIDGLTAFVSSPMKHPFNLDDYLIEACNLIQKQFSIREVSIGLKGDDGLYRFKALVGFREDAERAMRRVAYRREEFGDSATYKGTMISKYTKLFLAEDSPYKDDEKDTYSRPLLLDVTRHSPSESIEGDYLDFSMLGADGSLLGWIEISGTRAGQLPDIATIKWVELIGQIIAYTMTARDAQSHLRSTG